MEAMTLFSIAAVALTLVALLTATRRAAAPRARRATNDSAGGFAGWGDGGSDCGASDGGCDGGGD